MSDTKLVWITPKAEELLVYIARVSNPKGQAAGHSPARLLRYLINHKHWSPFEMASACVEINTTRDIGRQILRHRSFSFQEFSQRYANPHELGLVDFRETRLQDPTSRQNSLLNEDANLHRGWQEAQRTVYSQALDVYNWAIEKGIAKEVARGVLPEGLTPTRLYMSGTIRSWIHYFEQRLHMHTQKEHRIIAEKIWTHLQSEMPELWRAIQPGELPNNY